jgi:hypothetical protein
MLEQKLIAATNEISPKISDQKLSNKKFGSYG